MDYSSEVINISKIKDSFFIGDKISASNLDVIIQFKISHIINACGRQVLNHFESIGIKYYKINWMEDPNQLLFDPKDEIVLEIMSFIKDALTNGEGLLIHSVKGENRCCVVVVIYLMKKYNWSLNKCIQFLNSKKQDVNIPQYFIEQLFNYEIKLSKQVKTKSTSWTEVSNKNGDEIVLRNTYINGLSMSEMKNLWNSLNKSTSFENTLTKKNNNKHILFADMDPLKKYDLINSNVEKDLFFKKNLQDVICHMNKKPLKSSIKEVNESTFTNTFNRGFLSEGFNNNYSKNKKLKLKINVENLEKLKGEYNNISPGIIIKLIQNDNDFSNFFQRFQNASNRFKKRPLSYKKDNDNKLKNFSLDKKNKNNKKEIIDANNNINIKQVKENNNKVLISLNNKNKMNNLINDYTNFAKYENEKNISKNLFEGINNYNPQNKNKRKIHSSSGMNNKNDIALNNFNYLLMRKAHTPILFNNGVRNNRKETNKKNDRLQKPKTPENIHLNQHMNNKNKQDDNIKMFMNNIKSKSCKRPATAPVK